MNVVCFGTVSIPATAGGDYLFTEAQGRAAAEEALACIVVNPSVEIWIINQGGSFVTSKIPNAVAGTAANSAIVCPAGASTTILHRSGPVRAISTSGTATVRVTAGEAP